MVELARLTVITLVALLDEFVRLSNELRAAHGLEPKPRPLSHFTTPP